MSIQRSVLERLRKVMSKRLRWFIMLSIDEFMDSCFSSLGEDESAAEDLLQFFFPQSTAAFCSPGKENPAASPDAVPWQGESTI